MTNNQNFIGAFARKQRATRLPGAANSLDSDPSTRRKATTASTPAAVDPVSVSDAAADSVQVWLDEVDGQMLRVDAPTRSPEPAPRPTPEPELAPTPSAPNDEVSVGPRAPVASAWSGANWEVDAFNIPHSVAELFFDEAFFRSIARHMHESVTTGLSSILVTSLTAGEGRSTVAIGTAIAAAATGLRVALVDADLDSPDLLDQLRLETEADWVSAIRHGESLESIAIVSLEDSLTLLPLSVGNSRTLPVTAMEIDRLVERLQGCFDLLVVDAPVASSWGTHRLAIGIDSCLIVRDARTTATNQVSATAAALSRYGVKGFGVVDNFCAP